VEVDDRILFPLLEPVITRNKEVVFLGLTAAKTVVQLLFSTGKRFTVDGLREKLREFFREEVRAEMRAVAALSNVELITALLSCNRQLASVASFSRTTLS
jgi:hypothetical protein